MQRKKWYFAFILHRDFQLCCGHFANTRMLFQPIKALHKCHMTCTSAFLSCYLHWLLLKRTRKLVFKIDAITLQDR